MEVLSVSVTCIKSFIIGDTYLHSMILHTVKHSNVMPQE